MIEADSRLDFASGYCALIGGLLKRNRPTNYKLGLTFRLTYNTSLKLTERRVPYHKLRALMQSVTAFAIRYALLSLGATLLLVVYALPLLPRTLSGWLWVIGLSFLFTFLVGLMGDVVLRYRPPETWRRITAVLGATVVIVISTASFFYFVGVVS
jgi:hypothetical protein